MDYSVCVFSNMDKNIYKNYRSYRRLRIVITISNYTSSLWWKKKKELPDAEIDIRRGEERVKNEIDNTYDYDVIGGERKYGRGVEIRRSQARQRPVVWGEDDCEARSAVLHFLQ